MIDEKNRSQNTKNCQLWKVLIAASSVISGDNQNNYHFIEIPIQCNKDMIYCDSRNDFSNDCLVGVFICSIEFSDH